MLYAAKDVADGGGPGVGRLLVLLGYGEETKHTTMEQAVETAGPIAAAVVGEPTNLEFAVAQRGLMMVDLLAEGDQRHAGYAAADGEFRNAALVLARDLAQAGRALRRAVPPPCSDTTATPTMRRGREPKRDCRPSRDPRHPQHPGLDSRRGGARAAESLVVERRGHVAAPGAVRDSGGSRRRGRRVASALRRARSAADLL
jgi:acetylornithine deacetylase/succinyl-diaminopimelate desuccinylase-like protein